MKHYLRPQSFHPKNVFTSVPLSQMIRAIERNSCAENDTLEMERWIKDSEGSGYKRDNLQIIERRARNHTRNRNNEREDTITFPIFHFKDMNSLKQILVDSENDFKTVIGDTKIIMAVKKHSPRRTLQLRTQWREISTSYPIYLS